MIRVDGAPIRVNGARSDHHETLTTGAVSAGKAFAPTVPVSHVVGAVNEQPLAAIGFPGVYVAAVLYSSGGQLGEKAQ